MRKKHGVVPVRVVEQVIRKSLDGEETSYRVEIPGQDEVYDLSELNGEIYTSVKSVKDRLHTNAEHAIDDIIKSAEKISAKYFANALILPTASSEDSIAPEDSVKVDLGDGTTANVMLPGMPGL
jgi:hypothetical protein